MMQGRASSRGASRGGRGGGSTQPQRKENILDLSKYQDKQIRVRFTGGREGTSSVSRVGFLLSSCGNIERI